MARKKTVTYTDSTVSLRLPLGKLPDSFQKKVAQRLGISIQHDTQAIIAARILDAIASSIGVTPARFVHTEAVAGWAVELGIDIDSDSARVAKAKIAERLNEQNVKALSHLKPVPGQRILIRERFIDSNGRFEELSHDTVREISSVKPGGKIYLKGTGSRYLVYARRLEKTKTRVSTRRKSQEPPYDFEAHFTTSLVFPEGGLGFMSRQNPKSN